MSVQRYCSWGAHWVDAKDATEVYTATRISGPEQPVHACWPHADEHHLQVAAQPVQPSAAPLIGRPDAAPIIPGGTT